MISSLKRKLLQEYDFPIEWNITGFGSMTHVKYLYSLLDVCKTMGLATPIKPYMGVFYLNSTEVDHRFRMLLKKKLENMLESLIVME